MIIIVKPGFLHLKDAILQRLGLPVDTPFKVQILSEEQASLFYREHAGRPFFGELVNYMTSGLTCFFKVDADDRKIGTFRDMIGDTDPQAAGKDTLRGTYGKARMQNVVHCSDSVKSAIREDLFFDGLD